MTSNHARRLPNTRCIVTSHLESRSATIAIDEQKEPVAYEDGTYLNPLWTSDEIPAIIDQDPNEVRLATTAATNKDSIFTIYDLPPKYEGPMHRSITLDYVTVAMGIVTLSMDDGTMVTLNAGDTVVQRGTMHKWGNPSSEWARLTSVMIQAKPAVVGGKKLEAAWPF